ncbi:MAG: Mitochondrial chaperone Frataxin [Peltula sp. TS41687]|nr:MAG: Mitochondrial chaperone Frataxin [Peltula sp. TS41687]
MQSSTRLKSVFRSISHQTRSQAFLRIPLGTATKRSSSIAILTTTTTNNNNTHSHSTTRTYHSTPARRIKDISTPVSNSELHDLNPTKRTPTPAPISSDDYNTLADEFFDELVAKLEALQEQRGDVDVEYSAGVLTLTYPPVGTYVLNKQPPNKQIWLSSPVSGPKRFDWVVLGESMHDKEGTGVGDWLYLRDGETLSDVLRKEIGVSIGFEEGTV